MTADPFPPVEITFFVPCYNEERHITGTLETLQVMMKEKGISYEILVVDDGSTDHSADFVVEFSKKNSGVPVILHRNSQNKGLGYHYLHSTSMARGRYYMLVNGDNDIPLESLSAIVEERRKADIIVPFVENQRDRPWFRRVLSSLFTFLVNLLNGHRLCYYNGPVIHLKQNIEQFKPNTAGFGYQAELLCRAIRHGCTYYEMPFRCLVKQKTHRAAFRPSNISRVLASLGRILMSRLTDKPPKARRTQETLAR